MKVLDIFSDIWGQATAEEKRKMKQIINGGNEFEEIAKRVLNYLNLRTGGNYRECKSNLKWITARLATEVSEQDCIRVVDRKCKEWQGTSMEKYLRPQTLFNETKFEQYLGELTKVQAHETNKPISAIDKVRQRNWISNGNHSEIMGTHDHDLRRRVG